MEQRGRAHALAKLGDREAWSQIKAQLDEDARRYPIAALLAQDGSGAFKRLAQDFRDAKSYAAFVQQTRDALDRHVPRNCYEQQYDRWLLACLDGDCGRRAAAEFTLHGS